MIDAAQTLRTVEADGGTGNMLADPIDRGFHFHLPVSILPVLRRAPIEVATPATAPTQDGTHAPAASAPTPNTEQQVESGTNLSNASTWANIAQGFMPQKNVLDAINGAASNGGANQQLGPQMDFAPVDINSAGGGNSGGGMGVFIFIALAIVGVLVWMHFRKKHAAKAE